ncbi:hypothetical protein V8E51_005083 [Hyaloscypha variabilis]
MDPPTHTHHNRTRIRTTSFIAEDNPHFATLAMQFHADRLFSRLDRLSPPRWKSQDELYEEANWKAGMRMTPCTPTPSGTPSPAATPYMFSIDKRYDTPESLSPPPFAHLTKHRGDYPIHSRTQSRKSSKSSISVSKPHRITKRIASKHSMITRSRLRECIPVSDNTTTTGDLTTTYVMLYHSMYLSSSRVEVVNGNFTTAIVVGRKVELTTTREVEISS